MGMLISINVSRRTALGLRALLYNIPVSQANFQHPKLHDLFVAIREALWIKAEIWSFLVAPRTTYPLTAR